MSEEMTEADWEELRRRMDSYEWQDQYGNDVTLIDDRLAMSPTERLRCNDRGAAGMIALRESARWIDEPR